MGFMATLFLGMALQAFNTAWLTWCGLITPHSGQQTSAAVLFVFLTMLSVLRTKKVRRVTM